MNIRSMVAVAALISTSFGLSGCGEIYSTFNPGYRVHLAKLNGQAELAQADGNRQIKVQEAKAAYESADYLAKAEVRKAQGVAQANKIMSESLGGPEGYLRWKYIEMLQETAGKGQTTVYVPTEAGLPITEAGRRSMPKPEEVR